MGTELVKRVVITTAIVGAVVALLVATYVSPVSGLGVFIGSAWGSLNLLAAGSVVTAVTSPKRAGKLKISKLLLFKFPALYGAGFLILRTEFFSPAMLLAGFSIVLLVIFLKALGIQVAEKLAGHGREIRT